MKRTDDQHMRARKARDAALIIPLMGLVLLTPPLAQIFAIDARIIGVPAVVVYIFAIWAALIFIAKRLAGRLTTADNDETPEQ